MSKQVKMNRGEWSEVYAFMKILSDGYLYAADADLNKIESVFFPVIKVIAEETEGRYEYARGEEIVITSDSGTINEKVPIYEFKENAEKLFNKIIEKDHTKGSFVAEETKLFCNQIKHKKLKSHSSNKRDITIVIHDVYTNMNPELGFSIKSQLGSPSTLFNPAIATNFTYEIISPLVEKICEKTNKIKTSKKLIDRISFLKENSKGIIFYGIKDKTFLANLRLIDGDLPEILAYFILFRYFFEEARITKLCEIMEEKNPLEYEMDLNPGFYKYKIKKFLYDTALGMTARNIWTGEYDATGGYIIVKAEGDIVCFHLFNINEFQNYLFKNTKLDTPSMSKHQFGEVYVKDNAYYFDLNLQIRFN